MCGVVGVNPWVIRGLRVHSESIVRVGVITVLRSLLLEIYLRFSLGALLLRACSHPGQSELVGVPSHCHRQKKCRLAVCDTMPVYSMYVGPRRPQTHILRVRCSSLLLFASLCSSLQQRGAKQPAPHGSIVVAIDEETYMSRYRLPAFVSQRATQANAWSNFDPPPSPPPLPRAPERVFVCITTTLLVHHALRRHTMNT